MSPTIAVSIQARLGSTRLPGKVLYHLGERRVLEWVIHRCSSISGVDDLVVAIGDRPENEAIERLCARRDVPFLVGPESNLLERHRRVVESTGCDILVRATADCPFLPPEEINRLLRTHTDGESHYTTNAVEEMPVGTAADVIDSDLLDELARRGETHPVRAVRESPDEWTTAFTAGKPWSSYPDAHVAVDTPAEYWTLVDALDAVGSDPEAVLGWVAERD